MRQLCDDRKPVTKELSPAPDVVTLWNEQEGREMATRSAPQGRWH